MGSADDSSENETESRKQPVWTLAAGVQKFVSTKRPIGVAVLALLVTVFGLLTLLGGVYTVLSRLSSADSTGGVDPYLTVFYLLYTAVGVATTVTGIGLWRLKAWAWSVAIVVLLMGLMVIASPFYVFSIFGLCLLIYLLNVREYFV